MRYSHVSIFALAVALAAPAYAQQSTTPMTSGATSGAMSAMQSSKAVSVDQIKSDLGKADIKDRTEVKGHLVTAQSPEGQPVVLVVGTKDWKSDNSGDFSQDKIRGELTQAGFKNIQFDSNANMVHGKISDDKEVLALSGQQGWRGTAGPAKSDTPDRKRLSDQLKSAGLDDTSEFKGKLVRAQTSEGRTLFVLVGPEDFKGDKSVDFTATDLTKFQNAGFKSAEVVQDATMVHGKIGDTPVIALAGSAITEPGATGSTQQ